MNSVATIQHGLSTVWSKENRLFISLQISPEVSHVLSGFSRIQLDGIDYNAYQVNLYLLLESVITKDLTIKVYTVCISFLKLDKSFYNQYFTFFQKFQRP